MNSISSRTISEHLCTLATLLEAEALRAKAFGAANARELSRQSGEVRTMANQLWDANLAVPLTGRIRAEARGISARPDAVADLEALGLARSVAAMVI